MSDNSSNYDSVTLTLSDDYVSASSRDQYTVTWDENDKVLIGGQNFGANGSIYGSNTYPWSSEPTMPWAWDSKIKLDGDGADIEVNGESLMGMIKTIEQRLNILKPNEQLESEWTELRALGDQYRALEQHILAKQATWDKLKAMPPPEIN